MFDLRYAKEAAMVQLGRHAPNPVPVAWGIGLHELASLDVNRRQFVVRICFSVGIGQNEDAKELLTI